MYEIMNRDPRAELKWKRWDKHNIIRKLVDKRGWTYAEIKRLGGNKYRIFFSMDVDLDPYDIQAELKVAKAVGLMLVKMHSGETT